MATIKDIARETGLGLATISKYINGGNVRPENKIAIDKAINELDFKINNAARALKTNKSKMIGIVIPELSNLFITTIITEIEDILMEKGYGVIVSDCRSNEEIEKKSVNFLLSKQVDGIINMPVSRCGEHINNLKIPVVLIDRQIEGFSHIGVDNEKAGELAANLLLEKGHKNIAIITGPESLSTAVGRVSGFKKALLEKNIQSKQVIFGDYTIESGYKSMKELDFSEITAVFTANYELTVGAVIALNELGLKIYEDISLVGFDNIELSKVLNPKLTIIAQPIVEIARKTAELMLRKLEGNMLKENVLLEPFIEQGKSIKDI